LAEKKLILRPRRFALFFLLGLICLGLAGCYDLETEIHVLPDGSGFFTTWVRVDRKEALLATAIGGRSLGEEIDAAVENLHLAAEAVQGVKMVDDAVFDEADKTVLRYRFLFDNVGALNRFWKSPAAMETAILLAGARLDFQSGGGKCGNFLVDLKVRERKPESLFTRSDPTLRRLDEETYRVFLEKVFSGRFRLRLVPPGKVKATDAPFRDAQGYPIYEKSLYNLFTGGLSAKVKSELACDEKDAPPPVSKVVTVGPAPSASETAAVMQAVPLFVQTTVEFNQVGRFTADLAVQFDVKPPMKEALEFYLPLMMTFFPGASSDMTWTAEKTNDGTFRYRFVSNKPINFKKKKNPFVFLGRDGRREVFRMKIPAFPWSSVRPKDAPARKIMTVKVLLREKISMTNASEVDGKQAVWRITDSMLKDQVTLEALSE